MITYTHCIILTWSQDGSICTKRRALNTSQSGYITCHGGHGPRILSSVHSQGRAETAEAAYGLDRQLAVTPRVKLYNSSPFAS